MWKIWISVKLNAEVDVLNYPLKLITWMKTLLYIMSLQVMNSMFIDAQESNETMNVVWWISSCLMKSKYAKIISDL